MSELAVAPESNVVPAVAPESDVVPPAAPLADCSREQQTEERYLAALEVLIDDALEHDHTAILVDALTWDLARIGFAHGTPALGDIIRRLGGYVCDLEERHAAKEEAEAARKAGHAPH